jgi:predicted RNase H-like nuclease (RuvC/YqgF family)
MGDRRAGKLLVPLLGGLSVLALGMAGVALMLKDQERQARVASEQQLVTARTQNEALSQQVEELEGLKRTMEEDLTKTRTDLTKSQEQLAKEIEAQEALSRSVNEREQEIARLAKDLEQARSEAKQATTQLSQFQSEREGMKQQLADLEQAKGDLESKVLELADRPTVELEKVLVTNDQLLNGPGPMMTTLAAASGRSGEVVVINREYDFIVMNLGKNHGLAVGQEFQIVRGEQVLGRVKVEKVYDELSAAAILPDSQKDTIREGDTVKAL